MCTQTSGNLWDRKTGNMGTIAQQLDPLRRNTLLITNTLTLDWLQKQKETDMGNLGTIAQRLNPPRHQPCKLENWQHGRTTKWQAEGGTLEEKGNAAPEHYFPKLKRTPRNQKLQSHMLHERPGGRMPAKGHCHVCFGLVPGHFTWKKGSNPKLGMRTAEC